MCCSRRDSPTIVVIVDCRMMPSASATLIEPVRPTGIAARAAAQDAVPLGVRRAGSADAPAVHGQLAEHRVGDRERSAQVFGEHVGEILRPLLRRR